MLCGFGRYNKKSSSKGVVIVAPLLERLPTKAIEALSPNEVSLLAPI